MKETQIAKAQHESLRVPEAKYTRLQDEITAEVMQEIEDSLYIERRVQEMINEFKTK